MSGEGQGIWRRVDQGMIRFMRTQGVSLIRVSLAVVFIWFGALKVLGVSPVHDLVARTVYWFNPQVFIPILGWWEFAIGVCFLFRRLIRAGVFLLFLQIGGTFLPLVILPEVCFYKFPFVLTMEGQYIVKNLLIISAAIVIGGSVHK